MRGDESINQYFTGTKECLSRSMSKAKHNFKNNIYMNAGAAQVTFVEYLKMVPSSVGIKTLNRVKI